MSFRIPVLGALSCALCLSSPAAGDPVATLNGVDDSVLLTRLYAIIGEATSPPAGPREARDRATEAADRVRRALRSEGYYAADVQIVRSGDPLRPNLSVVPGMLYRFADIDLQLTPDTDDTAMGIAQSAFTLQSGDAVSAEAVILSENQVVEALSEGGYPDAAIGERDIVVDHETQSASGDFAFNVGRFARFGTLEIEPGGPLRNSVIERLSPFEAGDPVNLSQLAEFSTRLRSLPGISDAEISLTPTSDDGVRAARVDITAGPRRVLELGGGYSTSDGIGVEGEWTRRNLYRGAETLSLFARLAQIDSKARLALELPHWREYGQTLQFNLAVESERTDAYDRDAVSAGVLVRRTLSPQLAVSLGLQAESAQISEPIQAGVTRAGSLSLLSASLGAVWDTRDDVFDPSSGFRLEAIVEPVGLIDDGFSSFFKGSVSASTYHALSERWVVAGRIGVGTILNANAEEIPADRRFFAGGGGSARGFDYQALSPLNSSGVPFGGVSLLELSGELRWRYSPRLGFAGFIDAAAAGGNPEMDFDALRAGAGFGVRYYTGFGPIRLDVATPLDRRSGETPVQVYISIGQSF